MSNIVVANLNHAGSDLFSDPENYMADVTDSELGHVSGGLWTPFMVISSFSTVTIGLLPL
ncbi:hypothetical protein [Pseudanabaena sp. PCC 6802]|uniref:hypothetical protein n=1 Tax=Pseudanabaena sp. PCC 6802 TaxID=118173 RepID=UPI0003650250|nr:hypothetical protein [Pseudanabaena sp. PCC 6802]